MAPAAEQKLKVTLSTGANGTFGLTISGRGSDYVWVKAIDSESPNRNTLQINDEFLKVAGVKGLQRVPMVPRCAASSSLHRSTPVATQ